ncbi:MAG: radical SAM protein [Candidatus Woesearchaeota archaeon]
MTYRKSAETDEEKAFMAQIHENNAKHVVDEQELNELIEQGNKVYKDNFDGTVWFERSIFTNWTCGIADCKYCYLSTRPKLEKGAVRSRESILAEVLLCKSMGWRVGYLTGGLRVEPTEYLVGLGKLINDVLGERIMFNYGPYTKTETKMLSETLRGMGCAIESFDPKLHSFICPSKPLNSLIKFLGYLEDNSMEKLITIILGIGETMDDVNEVIDYVQKYNITSVQLCFIKPQYGTVFAKVESPDPKYMAWWTAKLRIACPKLIIKIALVRDRIEDFSLMLNAGANCFSRYLVFNDFGNDFARQLVAECKRVNRTLEGNFLSIPAINESELFKDVPIEMLPVVKEKFFQYIHKLEKNLQKQHTVQKALKTDS